MKIQTDDAMREIEVNWQHIPRVGDVLYVGNWPKVRVTEVAWISDARNNWGLGIHVTVKVL